MRYARYVICHSPLCSNFSQGPAYLPSGPLASFPTLLIRISIGSFANYEEPCVKFGNRIQPAYLIGLSTPHQPEHAVHSKSSPAKTHNKSSSTTTPTHKLKVSSTKHQELTKAKNAADEAHSFWIHRTVIDIYRQGSSSLSL